MAKTTIFESRSDEKRWIHEIKEIVKEVKINIHVPVCIFAIPATQASSKPEAYMPQLMGLGPYHHGDPNLQDMERYKIAAASRLQKEQFKTLRFEQLVDKLMESEDDVRACYHKYLDIEGKTLMWILAIDGLFLQEFLQNFPREGDSKTAHSRDVMLLENQIPFLLFNKFISIKISLDNPDDNSLQSNLLTFCRSISPVQVIKEDLEEVLHFSHLLDLLYHMIVPNLADSSQLVNSSDSHQIVTVEKIVPKLAVQKTQEAHKTQNNGTESDSSQPANSSNSLQICLTLWDKFARRMKIPKKIADIVSMIISVIMGFVSQEPNDNGNANSDASDPENSHPKVEKIMIPSASTLSKKAGVEFCPISTGDNPTIKFNAKEKKFYLPVITLDVHSEVIIRNLIAYEALTMSGSLVFGRFTDLLDWLIDSPEDVKLLREKKIIHSKLKRDDEVFRLFDGIGKSVGLTNAPSIDKTIEDVNNFYDNSWWVRFDRGVNTFVYDLWKAWTIVASILLLLLTGVQSFCSVYTSCPNMIKFNSTAPN